MTALCLPQVQGLGFWVQGVGLGFLLTLFADTSLHQQLNTVLEVLIGMKADRAHMGVGFNKIAVRKDDRLMMEGTHSGFPANPI